jgi:N-acetylglucosamine-6-sulfatase
MAQSKAHNARASSRARQSRVRFALVLGAVAAALLSGCGGGASGHAVATGAVRSVRATQVSGFAGRPNIVFVLTDDLSTNLVRYMPHVLQMQRRGVRFSNYFVTDSLCCPSRASILTGRFPHDTRVFDNSPPEGGYSVFHERGEEAQTFAVALQHEGYRTALMGKYLNGYEPNMRDGTGRPYIPRGWNEWDVAGDGYPEYGYRMNSNGHVHAYGYAPSDYLTGVLARKGLSFIDRSAHGHRPFMLELATFAPHAPYTPAPRDVGTLPLVHAPRSPAFNTVGTNEPAWLASFEPLDAQQIASIDEKFRRRAEAVQAVDRMIGGIEARLAADGLAQNTYIVFSSDNGLHMGEHRLLPGKLTAFDTDVKVPLVITGPGVPPGRTVAQMTENVDLCPSFEELAGAPIAPSVDGHSLVSLMHGARPGAWRKEVLIEHHGRVDDRGDPDLPVRGSGNPPSYEAIRSSSSLYVEYATGEREYYQLRHDPFELDNLAGSLSAAHARRLHRTLARIERCHGRRACWQAQSATA